MVADLAGQGSLDVAAPGYLGRVLQDGAPVGTCFQAAAGVLVTAWHILRDMNAARIDAEVWVEQMRPGASAQRARVVRLARETDAAVLSIERPFTQSVTGFALSDVVSHGAELRVQGYGALDGDEDFRSLPASGRWTGPAVRDDGVRLAVMASKDIPVGMSGAPVRRAEDDAVVGVVSAHYNSARDGWYRDNVWLSRVEDLIALFDGLASVTVDDGLGRLRAYLRQAVAAAQAHPNLGDLRGGAPSLSTVYLARGVAAHEDGQEPAFDGQVLSTRHPGVDQVGSVERVAAERIIGGAGHCVITAGPGMGKSSLLRLGLAAAARPWLGALDAGSDRVGDVGGTVGGEVPVLVEAARLAGPGPAEDLIAAAVRDELRDASWDAGFFRRPPAPGARWLILVDGLDEVLDSYWRGEVLRTVATLTGPGRGAEYRIVLTTRPLYAGELAGALARTGWPAERYTLLPFEPADVTQLARRWFTALEHADPRQDADRFTAALERRGLQELARTPLLASMLCQLYAGAPDQDLPAGRGEIYRLYYQRLINRLYAPGPSGAFAQEALARYGPAAAAGALQAVQGLRTALGRLALQRRAGNRAATLQILLADPAMRRPGALTPEQWSEFVASVLRRSGLLDFRGGDFVFLHQTLLDFLAARAAPDRAGTLTAMLTVAPLRERRRKTDVGRSRWKPPQEDASYLGFLLDPDAHDDPLEGQSDLDGALTRLAEQGGLEGCRFLTAQIALHTALPEIVKQRTIQELANIATHGYLDSYRLRALRILATIDREQALDLAIAKAPRELDYGTDFEIFLLIASLDRPRAVALLTPLVTAPARWSNYEGHIRGAEILARLDPSIGLPALRTLATRISRSEKKAAQRAAHQAGGEEKLMEVLRAQREVPRDKDRIAAAEALARIDRREGVAALSRLAEDSEMGTVERAHAVAALTSHGDERGAALLPEIVRGALSQALAADDSYARERTFFPRRLTGSRKEHRAWLRTNAEAALRIHHDIDAAAAESLLAEHTAAQTSRANRAWLAALTADTSAANETPSEGRTMADHHMFMRFVELQLSLSRPPEVTAVLPSPNHGDALPSELSVALSDPAAADFLADYAADTTSTRPSDRWGERNRAFAIAQLLRLRDPRAESLLSELLADHSAREAYGFTAISGLRWINDERHIALFDEIATSLPFWRRLGTMVDLEHTAAERAYRRTAMQRLRDETPWWRPERKAGLVLAGLLLRLLAREEH